MREQQRVAVIQSVFCRKLTMAKAAMVLGISKRHMYRLTARIGKEGVRGVIHGNRGRRSPRELPAQIRQQIVKLARDKYRGFNDHHLTEKLAEVEGVASPRKRRPPRYRGRRARRAAEGMLLQVDGSPHDWLEGRGPLLTLVGAIDDATAHVSSACFLEHETSWAYLQLFVRIFTKKGLPQALYADRHSIFWTDRAPTPWRSSCWDGGPGRRSAGRWRNWASRSSWPPPRRRRAGSSGCGGPSRTGWSVSCGWPGRATLAEAQAVLTRFLPAYNRRFAKVPTEATPAWREVDRARLVHTLCFTYRRVVTKDNTVAFQGAVLALPKRTPFRSWAHKRVEVHVLLDGSVEICLQEERLARFDAHAARTLGLYCMNRRREVVRYGPDTTSSLQRYAMAP